MISLLIHMTDDYRAKLRRIKSTILDITGLGFVAYATARGNWIAEDGDPVFNPNSILTAIGNDFVVCPVDGNETKLLPVDGESDIELIIQRS